jgi:hypothetical protein
MLPGGLEHEYGFACECGCDEIVPCSAAEFERDGGVWFGDHRANDPAASRVGGRG